MMYDKKLASEKWNCVANNCSILKYYWKQANTNEVVSVITIKSWSSIKNEQVRNEVV